MLHNAKQDVNIIMKGSYDGLSVFNSNIPEGLMTVNFQLYNLEAILNNTII